MIQLDKNSRYYLLIFIIAIISILCLSLFYGSIKFTYNYLTKTNEQICQLSNSTLIDGQCHSECNQSVKDQRNMLLIKGIAFPIFAILLIFGLIILLKTQFKENLKRNS